MARRPRSSSNVSSTNNIANIPRAPTSSPLLRKQIAVASDSIYHNNLTVLKRGDPSVTSIIDQFSHVCLYNYNGKSRKWAREGFEGSMFIVEHQDEPTYGIFILNRMGTGDFIRRIYPEDDMEVFGKYLMYRYYPDFTQKRLSMGLPYPIPDRFRLEFDREFSKDNSEPDDTDPTKERKKQGNSITLGFWGFPQEAHEPLEDVMMRLREYIKKGQLYPEEFRYFPGRPGSHAKRPSQTSIDFTNDHNGAQLPQLSGPSNVHQLFQGSIREAPSEVDKLFAKLQPQSQTQALHTAPQPPSTRTMENWFATLAGQNATPSNLPTIMATTSTNALPTAPTAPRGLALLDSIFASVSQPGDISQSISSQLFNGPPPPHQLPSHPEEIQIVSPKPQSSALPQILNQNVISTLLGLSPVSTNSRSSSAALSSNSSQRSGAKRYEGDNELSDNEGRSEGEYSVSSTVLDADTDPAVLSRGSPLNLPAVSYPTHSNGSAAQSVSVQGDVTPRAGMRGMGPSTPLLTPQRPGQPFLSVQPPAMATSVSASAATGQPSPGNNGKQRQLVPFSTDHELWPYPRPPLNDNEAASDAEVIELDFADTRALSDPTLFKEKQTRQQGQGKVEKKRKTKKEKAAEREKDREAIENGWDDPTKGQVTLGHASGRNSTAPPQPAPSSPAVNGKAKTSTNNNGTTKVPETHVNGTNGVANTAADLAREALLSSLASYPKAPARDLTRKQFVQEVLSLIYSDNAFVDRLYQEYASPSR